MKTKLTIIIPARNEKEAIVKTLDSLHKNVKTKHMILVVDDSNDGTTEVVKKYIKMHKNVSFIKGNPKKKSFARALKIGFSKTKTEAAVVVMADLCDDPKTIDGMFKKISEGYDIVCGSRYMKGGKKVGGPVIQNIFSFLICKTLGVFTGIPTIDVSNAFKMYKLSILEDVTFNLSSGVEASMELTLQAFFNGAKITEIPTTWLGRTLGQTKFKIFDRTPKYARIIRWSIENSFRKKLGLKLKEFYISSIS